MSPILRLIRSIHREESGESIWMLPYSTLMLILMIFFAALYGFSYLQSVEYETAIADLESTRPEERESAIRKEVTLAQSMKKFIEEREMADLAEVRITARYIKLELSSPVLFDSASAVLKGDITPLFEELARHLARMENVVIVEGHTDNIPIHTPQYRSNWELSAARAFSVIYYFIQRGLSPDRLIAHGFGEYRPAFANDTEIGRAKNRRIEITVLRSGMRA